MELNNVELIHKNEILLCYFGSIFILKLGLK